MTRSADYTIKGFLYQFNKTLLEILNSQNDETITIEGIIEDVDVVSPSRTKAIQCKYHEASSEFKVSTIYKPLLQMMIHFKKSKAKDINYILFAHFPNVTTPKPTISESDLQSAIDSKNKSLKTYIEKLDGKVDFDTFLSKFKIEFAPSFDNLVPQVTQALKNCGIAEEEVETLSYPNAINMVAVISTKHEPKDREITKAQLLESLKTIRKTAISHWTMALRSKKQVLDARRKQLRACLSTNSRLRYLVFDPDSLDDFDKEIVLFIDSYLTKYHSKSAHISTPIFCLRTSIEKIQDIQFRLHSKGISSTDGYIGRKFDESHFLRPPIVQGSPRSGIKREFSLRLLRWDDHRTTLNKQKCDDLIIIGNCTFDELDTKDVNVEELSANSIKEIGYVMGVSDVYE